MPLEESSPCRSILIVNSDERSANILAATLRDLGNDVEIAYDWEAALKVEDTFRPDMVLIDLGLPGMGPYTLARFIRAQPTLRKVTLVSTGAGCEVEDLDRGKQAGFRYHLTKPADPAAVRAMFTALGLAEETGADAARRWVRTYEEGIITGDEFALRIVESGARHDPAEMAHLIPEELLDAVRKMAEFPPKDVSSVLPEYKSPLLSAEEIQALRENVFKGIWKWFRFFNA